MFHDDVEVFLERVRRKYFQHLIRRSYQFDSKL